MYIPKNRIQTDLYTNGGEYVYASTQNFYKGFYWKTFDGKIYTGKSPSNKPNQLLEKYQTPSINNLSPTQPLTNSTIVPGEYIGDPDNDVGIIGIVIEYETVKNPSNITNPNSKYLPVNYFPSPTEENYKLGIFERYFALKANENLYQEINKETYTKLKNKDSDWMWELYIPFIVSWTISGNKEETFKANKNSVLLTEQRLKRKGLQRFLKEDYLKFYK